MENLSMERICACALGHIFGYQPKYSAELVARYGSAEAVFALDKEELDALFGSYSKYKGAVNEKALDEACKELDSLYSRGYQFVALSENDFPALLRECPDPPAGLYVRSGSPVSEIFNARPSVSIVGTRDISPYGKEWCPKIVGALAGTRDRPAIVSGLAIGVDICAHMAALAYGLPTIGVMATGIDAVYPRCHGTAAGKIAAAPGSALVSDYPPGTQPVALNFLRRNRIIAGMSGATILVESKEKGGGMMTARLAAGYGREVFAVPGRMGDRYSKGCNALIGEKIAEPLPDLPCIATSVGLTPEGPLQAHSLSGSIQDKYAGVFSEEDIGKLTEVAGLVRKSPYVTGDGLCRESDLPFMEITRCISILESDGFIETDLLGRCTIHGKFM